MCALLVELPQFSGPLDLLLSLIQKRRLDVTAVSLAVVADQYLGQVLALEGDLDALSAFLLLASQLLVIKSRALLPAATPEEGELDPAVELQQRLVEYQVLQAAARWLGEREACGERCWPRAGELPAPEGETTLSPISAQALTRLLAARLERQAGTTQVATLDAPTRPSLLARARALLSAASAACWEPLEPLLGPDLPSAVATFLALLALVRRGVLVVRQADVQAALEFRRSGADPAAASDIPWRD